MADPVQYNSFAHMLSLHAPYILVGAVALIGATLLVLKQMGVLIFGKSKEEKDCEHCVIKPSDNNDLLRVKCSNHDELHDTQVAMISQQKINTAQLLNGKLEFKEIKEEIGKLKVGVGILLDRSGGRPQTLKDM